MGFGLVFLAQAQTPSERQDRIGDTDVGGADDDILNLAPFFTLGIANCCANQLACLVHPIRPGCALRHALLSCPSRGLHRSLISRILTLKIEEGNG